MYISDKLLAFFQYSYNKYKIPQQDLVATAKKLTGMFIYDSKLFKNIRSKFKVNS